MICDVSGESVRPHSLARAFAAPDPKEMVQMKVQNHGIADLTKRKRSADHYRVQLLSILAPSGSFMLFLSCFCYAFVRVCLLVSCGNLLGRG